MAKASKIRASKQGYTSSNQLVIEGFETPFHKHLNPKNRWIVMSHQIPWDELVSIYQNRLNNKQTGAEGINPRVVLGSLIIKHTCNLSDRETVDQIQENVYMQYFLGYSSFSDEPPFDPSLMVSFRKRLGMEDIGEINELIVQLHKKRKPQKLESKKDKDESANGGQVNKGELLVDATACPQDIAFPTDLDLLNGAREKSEELIDTLHKLGKDKSKPRTYRKIARKAYLKTAQKKNKTKKDLRSAIKKQLNFLRRNLHTIDTMLDAHSIIPLDRRSYKNMLVIRTLFNQQERMFREKTHSVENRIVSIKQPFVRPIVRGKAKAKVEFGAKTNVSLVEGFSFLDHLSWEAYNEGTLLKESVENYKRRFGFYPESVLVDQIYCNRENRTWLKGLGIKLKAKPLGRPSAVKKEHVSPGERNPIEGKFGQAKTAFGLDRIKARTARTSESWIATIFMVLNLVKLTGRVPLFLKRIMDYFKLQLKIFYQDNKTYNLLQNV